MNNPNITPLDQEDFENVWDIWVCALVRKIPTQMDSDFKKYANFKVRDLNAIKPLAKQYYLDKRETLKKEFYGPYAEPTNHLMDFHKLSAVLCRTLIEHKVYYYDVALAEQYIKREKISSKNTDWLVHNALVNYRLAFYASIDFLFRSILFRLSENQPELFEQLREQGCLNLYTENSTHNHESFENSLVLDFAKRDVNNHSFDCFLYSTIMFQLEEYNIQRLKSKK